MADAVPEVVPVPVPTDTNAPGSIFQNYDPQGAMGGLFAPAYIKGFAPSEQAVAAWNAAHHGLSRAQIEETRMPPLYQKPTGNVLADGVYGGGVPATQNYGDPRGMVDPDALRAAAMGLPYDMQARRDAIAARLAQNQALQNPPTPPPPAITQGDRTFGLTPDEEEERRKKEWQDEVIRRVYPGGY